MRHVAPILLALCLFPLASAHGDLEINELETLAIRDFEGQEDSFPWEGFEIWDVYVGEGYNESLDSDGMYFKANFAGDGTARPSGGQAWTVTFTWLVGDEPFERQFTHDGTTITTDFESFEWMLADGNVLQVKAWVPVADWTGKSVHDIVLVSSVDGTARDTAPGGVHDPATGQEVPVQGPSTVIFPPLGEGRMVDEVLLTGPAKYMNASVESLGDGKFTLTVTNVLAEQGQHIFLHTTPTPGWTIVSDEAGHNLNGAASGAFELTLTADSGAVTPLVLDLVSDIGGRRMLYAVAGADGIVIVEDPMLAQTSNTPAGDLGIPAPGIGIALVALAGIALARRNGPRK